MTIEFGTLNFNNLVLLGIALIGLINTILTVRAAATAKQGNAIAVETRDIAKKTEVHTKNMIENVQTEQTRMSELLNGTLATVARKRRTK